MTLPSVPVRALARRSFIGFVDPKKKQPPVVDVYQATASGPFLTNCQTTLSGMALRGVHFSICDMTTRVYARIAAGAPGLKASHVHDARRASAMPNAHLLVAGIVAVTRAQERDYTLPYLG